MSLPKPAFFRSDRRPAWRSALVQSAIWVRLRFRNNPGFATATVAGSVGLVLALALLLNGGLQYLKGKPEADEHEQVASLGDPEETEASKSPETAGLDDLPATPASRKRELTGTNSQPRRHDPDEAFLNGDDEQDTPPLLGVDERSKSSNHSEAATGVDSIDIVSIDDDANATATAVDSKPNEIDEEADPVLVPPSKLSQSPKSGSVSIAGLRSDDESTETDATEESDDRESAFMAEDEPLSSHDDDRDTDLIVSKRTKPAKQPVPLLADDAGSDVDESDKDSAVEQQDLVQEDDALDGSAAPAAKPGATTVVTKPSGSKPAISSDEPESDDESFAPPQSKAGWKYSTTKPRKAPADANVAPNPAPDRSAKSRSVETAVYAAPAGKPADPPMPAAPVPPARDSAVDARKSDASLTLSIKAPRNVAAGQTFDIELLVTNTSRATIEGASLSVALPPGLSHPLGPDVEQPIESLKAGATHRARLTVRATTAGDVTPTADVAISGKVDAKTTTTLRVGAIRGASANSQPRCDCLPPVRYVW